MFFSADDWFHLRVVQIHSFREFLNFFSFIPNQQSISFYRPVSTQLFFFVFNKIFGLNPLPYYLFGLFLFLVSIKLILELFEKLKINKIAIIFYIFAASNFTRLTFISAFQELFLIVFVVWGINLYLKNDKKYLYAFILALLSKETAIIFWPLLQLINYYKKKKDTCIWILIISGIYLVLRLFLFKGVSGDSYGFDFSIKKLLNTTMWYGLWGVGLPEIMVDYVASGLKILPKFFVELKILANLLLLEFGVLVVAIIINFKDIKKKFIFGFLFFIISLLPVVFMPWHKYSHALTLPMIGIALALGNFKKLDWKKYLLIGSFVVLNLSSMFVLSQRFYSVNRSKIAKKVYNYFLKNYKDQKSEFVFINEKDKQITVWGESKQINYVLSGSDFFKVFYKDKNYKVFFEDLDKEFPKNAIKIESREFLE